MKLSLAGMLFLLIIFVSSSDHPLDSIQQQPAIPPAISPQIPEKITFCDEEVPVQYFDVYESLERELIVNTYFHSQTLMNIKRANRYFPEIVPILRQNNIPEDFKYLAVAESGFSYVVSPAGATGFWQLMENTAKEKGLEINDQVDERYHTEKATLAACKYFKDSYAKYNNWTMVAASYNAGRAGIDRQIERQGVYDYYDLLLFEETARYIFRILAIKLIMENPQEYGFIISESEHYDPIPYHSVSISGNIEDMGAFAKEHGTNYKLLKMFNPWLRDNKLINTKQKTYEIRIPDTRKLSK